MDSPIFRKQFPEFGNVTKFTDSQVCYWLGIGEIMVSTTRWGRLRDYGVALFTAHNIVLEAQAMATAAIANKVSNPALAPVPGLSTGPQASKSVDKVSVAYDTTAALELEGGNWNLTVYGTRFLRLAKMAGAGPVQINGSNSAAGFTGIGVFW